MSVQKCSSLLRPSTTVVIDVTVIVVDRIHQAEIAVTIILTSSAEIAVTVIIISCAEITVELAIRIDGHHNITNALALHIPVCIHISVIQLISHITLTIICQLTQLLLKFDSGIKQCAWSTIKKNSCKKLCDHLNLLTLIIVCSIIKNSVCVKKVVKIVKVNDRLLFEHSAEMILVNE